MPKTIVSNFVRLLQDTFGPALTRPAFVNLLVIACGWLLTDDAHTITATLVATGVAGQRHHEAFHRFFSRGTWNPDRIGYWLLQRILPHLREAPLRVAIDDTLAQRKGAEVFGIGSHLDPVRSTKLRRVLAFGHCWVVLSVLLPMPFSQRWWALPILFRLYRTRHECEQHGAEYRKKTELARQMLDLLCSWTEERRIELAVDSAYCNDTVTRDLPERFVLFGAMRPDAVLTALPPAHTHHRKGGRPRQRGELLPKPEALAHDPSQPWSRGSALLYGRRQTVQYKSLDGQWYRACGVRLLRIVIVRTVSGSIPFRVFFCSDATLSVAQVLQGYSYRWAIEVFFREAKQLLGFAIAPVRKAPSVLRVAPFIGLLYTTLVLWFLEGVHQSPLAAPPFRPWYTHKHGYCFVDILRTARRALSQVEVLVPSSDSANLHKLRVGTRTRAKARVLVPQ